MRRVQGTVFIAAPPAEVYAFLAEPTNVPRWQTGVVSSERTSPPPTVAGSTGRVVLEVMGQRVTANTKVLEAIPDQRLALATSVSGMSVVGSLDLAAAIGARAIQAEALLNIARAYEALAAWPAARAAYSEALERFRALHFDHRLSEAADGLARAAAQLAAAAS